MDLLRPPVYNETPNNNSTNSATNDFKQQAQSIRDLASAMKQLEQAAKSADRAVSSLSKRTYNTKTTGISAAGNSAGASTGGSGQSLNWHQQYLANKSKIKEFKQFRKEAAYSTERKLDTQAIKNLKKQNRSSLKENVFHPLAGALLKGGAVLVGIFKLIGDKINKTVDNFTKQFNNTTFSTNTIYKETNKIAAENRMGEIYDRVAELNKIENGLASNLTNDIKNGIAKLKALGSTSDEVNNSLTKLNATVLKVDQNMSNILGIQKGVDINTSTKYGQGIQGILLDYFYDLWYEELPNKYGKKGKGRTKGIQDIENQTYIIQHEDYSPTAKAGIQAVYSGGNFANITTEGWEGWNAAQGVYIPGVDYSEAAKADMRYNYIMAQSNAYDAGGLEGQQALVEESIKQTRILQHLSGSLASFDEVEQVSAFSQADTAEEAKKEVKESRLTNDKLDEQIEQWAKQYNLTDKEKQILTDLYNQGFSLTALQSMLDANLNLDEVYNALQAFLAKGGTLAEAEAQLSLALAGFPTEIKLTIPKDAKVKLDVSNLDALKEGLGKVPGSAVLVDTPEGGNAFLEQLVNSGYLDAYTASEMTRFGWTKSEIEKWYLDYVKTYGTAPQLDPKKNEEFKKEAVPGNLYNYYKKQKVLSNNNKSDLSTNTYFTSYTDAKNGLGTTDLANYTNFPSLNPMADSSLYTSFITATIQAASTDLETESGAQGTGNTFIFNLNGSVYGGDKRIPLEFARQMNDALVDYNKKKGT